MLLCPHLLFTVLSEGKCRKHLDLGAMENTFYSCNKHFETTDGKLFIQFYTSLHTLLQIGQNKKTEIQLHFYGDILTGLFYVNITYYNNKNSTFPTKQIYLFFFLTFFFQLSWIIMRYTILMPFAST